MKQSQRARTRLFARRVLLPAVAFSILLALSLIFIINVSDKRKAVAASAGDYRTKASGDWSDPLIWEKFNGASWVNATASPTVSDGVIEIQASHYITITTNITIDQLVIDENGMIAGTAGSVTVLNGAETDITVNGYWNISNSVTFTNAATMTIAGYVFCQTNGALDLGMSSTVTVNNYGVFEKDAGTITESAGHWIINSGGSYRHNMDGGNIPLATWADGSNCEITGAIFSAPSNLAQPFYNFSWSCASQPANLSFNGELTTVQGDFRITSTGTGSVNFNTTNNVVAVNIGRSYYQDGGEVILTNSANTSMVINGDLSISDGTIDMSQSSASATGNGTGSIFLKGTLNNTGGLFIASSIGNGTGNFHFANAGIQTFTGFSTFGSNVDVYVDNGTTLDLDTKILAGEGNFTLSDGGGIIIGHFNGITLSASAGNIQMQGRRTFSPRANYTYKADVPQLTGDGLPTFVNNLTIDNSSGVILSNGVTVTGILTLASGTVNTSTDTLKLGINNTAPGTLIRNTSAPGTVTGWFGRWISSTTAAAYLFPLSYDGRYRAVNMTFTSAPANADYDVIHFAPLDPGEAGLPFKDGDYRVYKTIRDGYWNVDSRVGTASYNIEVFAQGFQSEANPRLLYRESASGPWTTPGAYTSATVIADVPVVSRLSVDKTAGQFAIGAADQDQIIPEEPEKIKPTGMYVSLDAIAPNPFFENLYVLFSAAHSGEATVTMMNAVGQIVVKETVQAEQGSNTWQFVENRNLVVGVYFVSVEMFGWKVTKRVIKYS